MVTSSGCLACFRTAAVCGTLFSVLLAVPAVAQKSTKPLFDVADFGIKGETADIKVSAQLMAIDAKTAELRVQVILPENYYISSMNPDVASPTVIRLTDLAGLQPVSEWQADHAPKAGYDTILEKNTEKFFGEVTWSQRLQSASGEIPAGLTIRGEMQGQFCSTGEGGTTGVCVPLIPPRRFSATLTSAVPNPAVEVPAPPAAMTGDPAEPGPARAIETEQGPASSGSPSAEIVVTPQLDGQPVPIRFTISLSPLNAAPGDQVQLQVKADIDRPWHTFALDQDPDMAGLPTEIELDELTGLELVDGQFTASHEPEVETPLEGIVQRIHFDSVSWTRPLKLTGETGKVSGTISWQVCKNGSCALPASIPFVLTFDSAAASRVEAAGAAIAVDGAEATPEIASEGLFPFLLAAVSAGFLALLTPCVFPMVPVTVAFFLKQSEKQSGSPLFLASIYCAGIMGTFTILGLLVAIAFGPTSLNELANNRWLNLVFAGLFLMFSLMLMGMFELHMPNWLLNWSSRRESSGGVIGALFMALTFTLVSFTCTFAFVGTLLVLAAKGDRMWPILGMLAFSGAFASPFFVLALFPSMLKKLPKSGGWMNTVKVTMGLVELALVLKFLSVADIGFSPERLPFLLDRPSFLMGWVAVACVTGLYLLNVFRMSHDMPSEGIGAVRCLFAILFLTLGGYIAVGTFSAAPPEGWLWHRIQAFAPPSKPEHLLDFRKAVEVASQQQKLLFVDFTGVNCVNCRMMENTVLSRPMIHDTLSNLVQVQLYTDEIPGVRDPQLRTELLEYNRELQREWFGDVTLPGYAVVTPDGKSLISRYRGLDQTGGEEFQQFLKLGIDRWNEHLKEQAVAAQAKAPDDADRL